jgi:tetratricopeptide (TPR) repeat protein
VTRLPVGARQGAVWVLLIVCIGGWVMPQRSIDYRRARWVDADALLFLPTGEYLSAASLGYQALLADALYLWSIQYYSHQVVAEGRQYLWRIFDVITDLDPHYEDAYLTGALMMGVDLGDGELAIQMLEKGAAQNPDGWIYPVEAGYYAWMTLGDLQRASAYFDRALAVPGVPDVIGRIRAGMVEMSGDSRSALALWIEIYQTAQADGDDKVASIAWQHVYDLKVDTDLEDLGVAIRRFGLDRGGWPQQLEVLVNEGYLDIVPVAPTGESYDYDPGTGNVADPRESNSRADR